MTGPAILLGAGLIAATMLEIDFRQRRRRRCRITRRDAVWLADALDYPDCPMCDRPLITHRRR